MLADPLLSLDRLYGFLLVLARVSGAFVWIPLPGLRNASDTARILLSLGITIALFPQWPSIGASPLELGRLTVWMLGEAVLGITIGLAVSLSLEAFVLGAQITALQAGYSYASTINPDTQADSGVLLLAAQLTAGLLFFAVGLDHLVVRALAASLQAHPPGTFLAIRPMTEALVHLGGEMFATALRLAMPSLGLLLLVDITLALFGRIHAQLQLLTLAFPLKMLAALVLLVLTAASWPLLFRGTASGMTHILRMVLER